MRRAEREITDEKMIEVFIAKEQIIRVAFYDNGDIYIVPVNYGYCVNNNSYTFYFHGAKAGRKYGFAQSAPKIGFEIDGKYELIEAEKACGHSARYQSVIGTGVLALVEEKEEKLAGLELIMKQATNKTGWKFDEKAVQRTAVFRLTVEKMSCKERK